MNKLTRYLATPFLCLILSSTSTAGGPDNTGYISSADMLAPFLCEFNDPPDCNVVGTSTLYRTAAGIGMNIVVEGLEANTPHTVWLVAFNNPSACAAFPHAPCGLADLGTPAVQAGTVRQAIP